MMKKTIQTLLLSLMAFWCPNHALAEGKGNGRDADAAAAQSSPGSEGQAAPAAEGQAAPEAEGQKAPVKQIQGYVGLRTNLANKTTLQLDNWDSVTATVSWQKDEFHITIETGNGKEIPLHNIYGFIDVNNYREIKQKSKDWFQDGLEFPITFDRLKTQVKESKGNVELQACYLQLLSTYSRMHETALVKRGGETNRFEELMKLRESFWSSKTIYKVNSVQRLLFFYEHLRFCEIELEQLKETESDQKKLDEEIVRVGKIAQACCNELLRCNDKKFRNLQTEHNVAAYDAYIALANPERSPVKPREALDIKTAIDLVRSMETHFVRYADSKVPDAIGELGLPLPSILFQDKSKLLPTEYVRILAKFVKKTQAAKAQEDAHRRELATYVSELNTASKKIGTLERERKSYKDDLDEKSSELEGTKKKFAETSAELKKTQKHLVLIVEETEEWKRGSLWNAVRAAVETVREQKPFPGARVFVLAANEARLGGANAGLAEWPIRGKPSRTDYLRIASVDQIGTIENTDPSECRYLVIAPELASGEITPTKAADILDEFKKHAIQLNVLQVLYPFDRRDRHLASLCFQSNGVHSTVEYDPDAMEAESFGQNLAATILQIWRPY